MRITIYEKFFTEDVQNYRKILIITNANSRYYKANKKVATSQMQKYFKNQIEWW